MIKLSVEDKPTRIMLVSKLSLKAYIATLKLVGDRDVVWIASNPYLPYKALKGRSAKIYSFNTTRFGATSINPSNLQEIIFQATRNANSNCAVILSCLSELLAIHGLNKLYHFLIHLIPAIELKSAMVIGMLLENAQSKRDEILVSTLFDVVLKLHENGNEIVLMPLITKSTRSIKLRFPEPLADEVDFSAFLP
jgi:hypothetical protein